MINQKGFSLIEMLIAVVVVTIGVIGTFSMISQFSEQSQTLRDNFVAAYLAQEGIEIAKNIRDNNRIQGNNWDNGLDSCYSGCEADYDDLTLTQWEGNGRVLYIENTSGYYKYIDTPVVNDIRTYYKRRITITPTAPDEMEIRADIYWEDKTMTVKTKIYNWEI
ncbi:MAG: prepilin-type N-terminal cleavage/methylation domain-containing protein [Parcubacteria group bacterium]|nr:MAG: Type 4 fimbrial biogenesis protein PilV [Parcubacteria bacterium 34_609]KUK98624.1 MAG: Type 4 fimbrial biogenesis protein PilV [Parcubacteria bacterium 32_520]NMB39798.1 prepilin-type N-terminal cleavage/methylation domain-containing protein [Parcubacteria group bacterium]